MESQTTTPTPVDPQSPPQYFGGMHPSCMAMMPGMSMGGMDGAAMWQQQQAMMAMSMTGDAWLPCLQESQGPGQMFWNRYTGMTLWTPMADHPGAKPTLNSDCCETADTTTIEPEAEPHQLATPSTAEGSLVPEAQQEPPEEVEEEQDSDTADQTVSAMAPPSSVAYEAGAINRRGRATRRRRDRRPDPSPMSRWGQDTNNDERYSYSAAGAAAAATDSWGGQRKKGGRGWYSSWDEGNSTWASNSGKRNKDSYHTGHQCPLHSGCRHTVSDLYTDQTLCSEVQQILAGSDRLLNEAILMWVFSDLKKLALHSTATSYVVQKLVDGVTLKAAEKLAWEIIPHMEDLYPSPHGNYVVTKVIECVPDILNFPIIEGIQSIGPLKLVRHRFGCRILERVVEHCSKEVDILPLAEVYTEHAADLCRHQYGNFVIQHLLEHGSHSLKSTIVEKMLPTVQDLAIHRTASHVVQKALEYSTADQALIRAGVLGDDDDKFREVACSRFGSYVVEELLKLDVGSDEVRAKLSSLNEEQKATPAYIRMKEAGRLD